MVITQNGEYGSLNKDISPNNLPMHVFYIKLKKQQKTVDSDQMQENCDQHLFAKWRYS